MSISRYVNLFGKKLSAIQENEIPYTYCRDEEKFPIKPLASVPVKQNSELLHGMALRSDRVDFLIASDSLPFEPERDDQIIRGNFRYTVLPVDQGGQEACFRYVTPCRQLMKIHAKVDQ